MIHRLLFILTLSFTLFTSCIHQERNYEPGLFSTHMPPKRVMVLVFDQMRPDFVQKYGLKNFQWLANNSVQFPNAYVGHLGSLTVVSHAVISTGKLPRHLPWHDDLMKDVKGTLGKKNAFYSTLHLSQDQYFSLLKDVSPSSLAQQLKKAPFPVPADFPEDAPLPTWGKVVAIGQKFYATMVFGGPAADAIVTLGPKRKEDPLQGWREPVGWNVPPFFQVPFGGRYFLDCNPLYGSEDTLYPMDGNRFYPGDDDKHLGGDRWVSDGVVQTMAEVPDWRAIFATFGSIDKVLHMLGEHDSPTIESWATEKKLTLKDTLQRADESLGQILEVLKERQLLQETAIILTADHGGQVNTQFHGSLQGGGGHFEYGKGENFENLKASPHFKALVDTGLLEVSSQDSMLRMWLKKQDRVSVARFADKMKQLPGIAEIYTKQTTGKNVHYIRTYRSVELKERALEWAKNHNQELVETMAAAGSPDVLGLLLDHHGYAFLGEHGGAQEEVQKIPFYVYAPNLKARGSLSEIPVRLVDVNPIVGRIMNLPAKTDLDGTNRAVDGLIITEKSK